MDRQIACPQPGRHEDGVEGRGQRRRFARRARGGPGRQCHPRQPLDRPGRVSRPFRGRLGRHSYRGETPGRGFPRSGGNPPRRRGKSRLAKNRKKRVPHHFGRSGVAANNLLAMNFAQCGVASTFVDPSPPQTFSGTVTYIDAKTGLLHMILARPGKQLWMGILSPEDRWVEYPSLRNLVAARSSLALFPPSAKKMYGLRGNTS